jgi:tetratricopeptide (TPR) repeat protein
MGNLVKQSIQSALEGNWEKAIKINKEIIAIEEENIQAINRLAFAHLQQGNYKEAISFYKRVLKLDPCNPKAEKNLARANKFLNYKTQNNTKSKPTSKPSAFIKEPGTTKQVPLVNTATESILYQLCVGQTVLLIFKRRAVEIRTKNNEYVGALPDDISFHLRNLTRKGNKYEAYIKVIETPYVQIFIKEVKRGKRVKYPSFKSFFPLR